MLCHRESLPNPSILYWEKSTYLFGTINKVQRILGTITSVFHIRCLDYKKSSQHHGIDNLIVCLIRFALGETQKS